jgi:hypothetical protein
VFKPNHQTRISDKKTPLFLKRIEMSACGFKKIFLKDLAAIKKRYHSRIERLVFDQIPVSENICYDNFEIF